jgi:hypothetical protein
LVIEWLAHPDSAAAPRRQRGASGVTSTRRILDAPPGSEVEVRITGFAALGYAVAVGVENMDLPGAPRVGAPAAEIRAALASSTTGLEVVAGGVALVLFAVFAVGLHRRLTGGWANAALVGGLAGAGLAAIGVASDALLLARADGLPDDAVRALFEIHPRLQLVAGPAVGLFLLGTGVAGPGRRSAALPGPLARPARVLGAALLPAPLALLAADSVAPAVVTAGFGLFSLWVFLTGLWLVLADARGAVLVQRALFLVLVVAAGLVGLVLLAFPGSTATFFSWGLAPPPLAAFAGGAYLGSAIVYAAALRRPHSEASGLVTAAAVLSASVLVVTVLHLGQFDFGRLQTWAWLVLFSLFTALTTGLAVIGPHRPLVGDALTAWARTLLAGVTAVLAVVAVALWAAPEAVSGVSPFRLPPLGGRFAGCWAALLAVLAGGAAWRGTVAAARWPALALVALPGCALLAALRTAGQLRADAAGGYVAGLALLALVGLAVLLSPARGAERADHVRRAGADREHGFAADPGRWAFHDELTTTASAAGPPRWTYPDLRR